MTHNIDLAYEYSRAFEHDKWREEIPFLQFPNDWNIQICPPFAGAVVRFRVKKKNAHVSVYLDCYDNLGFMGAPHWEIYPDMEGENSRYLMNDVVGLLSNIAESLERQIKEN